MYKANSTSHDKGNPEKFLTVLCGQRDLCSTNIYIELVVIEKMS